MNKINLLKNVPLLEGLPPSDIKYIAKIAKEEAHKSGGKIFSESSSGEGFYFVVRGRIKIYTCSPSGKTKTLAYLDKNEFFGEMALFDRESRSASAEAVENSEVLIINKKDFQKLLLKNPALTLKFLKAVCQRLRQADKEIESLTFQNVFSRIAHIILKMADKYGKPADSGIKIGVNITHHDLAQLAGTAREMATRILQRLKKIGCIQTDSADDRIVITNIEKIRELIYY